MSEDFQRKIREMAQTGGELQQTISSGLFGIADADLFESLVRNTFPGAVVGGVTNDQIEGFVLRVGTGQTRVFKDEIEGMLEELGEDRVSQSSWNVEAKRWSGGQDSEAQVTGQRVTVRVDGVQRILNDLGDDIVPQIVEQMVERGWPPGANTAAVQRPEVGNVAVNPLQGEIVYTLDKPSVDASSLRALESFPRSTIQTIASVDNPLGLSSDRRVEMERTLFSDYDVREVEVQIIP